MESFFTFVAGNLPLVITALAGIVLLVVEVFMPGFGVAGIAGGVLMTASVIYVWCEYGMLAGLWMSLATLFLAGLAIMFSLRSAGKGQFFRNRWGLKELPKEAPETNDLNSFIGKEGIAVTPLRPAGICDFDGVRLNVVSEGDYITEGTPVRIEKIEGIRIVARKK